LSQKANIILGIEAEVIDAVFELTDAFDTHAKGKARILAAVDIEVVEHFGMDHAAAQDFDPAGMFANAATDSAADAAVDVHFCTGFCEREIGRAETDADIFSEHFLYKEVKGLFQVGKRDVLVHIQPFGLVEETVCPGADGLVAVHAAGADDPDGRPLFLHRAGLYAAGVRTQ
jgi:hypothetical protein